MRTYIRWKQIVRCIVLYILFTLMTAATAETSATFGMFVRRDFDGVTYKHKNQLTSILLLGVDQNSDEEIITPQTGGQSDFMMLVVIDNDNKKVYRLQIDRDTMTEITTMNIMGHVNGTRIAQICLSHCFGNDEDERGEMAISAVSKLLEDEEIDFYITARLDAIARINDALGGVTVTLPDDYSMYDPEMQRGVTLTLHGKQAEYMVRNRYEIADGSNEMRMTRQLVYMNAAVDKLKANVHEDKNFINKLLDEAGEAIMMNISRGRCINLANQAFKYEICPIEYLAGEYEIGVDGFMEFHADPSFITNWVKEVFYRLP